MKPVLVFLVNGPPDCGIGIRGREFSERLRTEFETIVAFRSPRKIWSICTFIGVLAKARPAVCYVLDMGYSGVVAAALYRWFLGGRVIVDTGDAIGELARLTGRGILKTWLTRLLESLALRISHRVVVRSHFHQRWLAERGIGTHLIPDGVDTTQFCPMPENGLRRKLGVEGVTTIGMLGSVIWNPRSQTCYGWELVELIRILRDQPVRGIIVGDGSGISHLKRRCADYGIEDRVVFLGRVAYESLPPILNVMDICLSTQTNDLVGQVRTTGKLPLYLACGRFVLASDVGEASRILPKTMRCCYTGTKDSEYPEKLAAKVRPLLNQPDLMGHTAEQVGLARKHFEYSHLARQLKVALLPLL